jgi:hypothetical protein
MAPTPPVSADTILAGRLVAVWSDGGRDVADTREMHSLARGSVGIALLGDYFQAGEIQD